MEGLDLIFGISWWKHSHHVDFRLQAELGRVCTVGLGIPESGMHHTVGLNTRTNKSGCSLKSFSEGRSLKCSFCR
jgi:hypothetical protein